MTKTMTRDQVKTWILANKGRFGAEDAVNFAQQLYDVMGIMEKILRCPDDTTIGEVKEAMREALK